MGRRTAVGRLCLFVSLCAFVHELPPLGRTSYPDGTPPGSGSTGRRRDLGDAGRAIVCGARRRTPVNGRPEPLL